MEKIDVTKFYKKEFFFTEDLYRQRDGLYYIAYTHKPSDSKHIVAI